MRGSKLVGAQLFRVIGFAPALVGGVSVALVTVWAVIARIVGRSNEKAVKSGKTIV